MQAAGTLGMCTMPPIKQRGCDTFIGGGAGRMKKMGCGSCVEARSMEAAGWRGGWVGEGDKAGKDKTGGTVWVSGRQLGSEAASCTGNKAEKGY